MHGRRGGHVRGGAASRGVGWVTHRRLRSQPPVTSPLSLTVQFGSRPHLVRTDRMIVLPKAGSACSGDDLRWCDSAASSAALGCRCGRPAAGWNTLVSPVSVNLRLLAPALAAPTAAGTLVSVGTGHDGSVRCACGTAVRVLGLWGRPASAADTCHCSVQGGQGQAAALSRAWTGGRWPSTVRARPAGCGSHGRPLQGRGFLGGQPTQPQVQQVAALPAGHRRAGGRLRVDQPCSRCRPGRRVACLSDPPGTPAPGALGRGGRSPASYLSIPSDCGTAGCSSEASLTTSTPPRWHRRRHRAEAK